MKSWMFAAWVLLFAIVSYGKQEVAGMTFAGDTAKATAEVKEYYKNESKNSILKKLEKQTDGKYKWVNLTEAEIAQNSKTPTYVISHGLNSTCDSAWITDSAEAIATKNPNALIVSINWDHYSGFDNNLNNGESRSSDANFAASTWINAVSSVVADKLGNLENIKSFIGHSYGTHLEAATAVKMSAAGNLNEKQISFVALDPAEETLTFTGDQDGNWTLMGENDKKSKNWNLPSNVISETYKSSGFLGSEERLGDYNYFLAAAESITPRALLGDLDTGVRLDFDDEKPVVIKGIENHSLAPEWFADYLENYLENHDANGGYSDGELIGGWYKSETDASRQGRVQDSKSVSRTDKGWDGVVNATSSVEEKNPRLEYSAGNQVFTEWQDLCNAEAQELLHHDLDGNVKNDKSNWEGTVLKPSKYTGYSIVHGGDNKDKTNVEVNEGDGINGGSSDVEGQNVATTQDSDADMTGSTTPSAESSLERLAEQLLKEHQNGESNVLPEDFLNDVFKNTLGEPKKNTDIAQTAYDDKISTLIEDKTVAQKVKDFVKGEIDKVVAKGEEWVENGGIRDAIKKGLDKILDGKVSDAQMQEILNLTDGLCNVNKDGGTSLIAALKTDGKDLAVSLAINELEKQLSNALPEDVADTLNSMLDVIADKGTAKDVRDSLLLEAQKLVSKYVPYDNSVKTINGVLQDIIDGNAIDAMDTVKGLGVSVGADALKDVLSKNLPPEVADRINGLLDGFAQNGAQGLTDAAKNEIYGLIDQYAPGGDSAKQLKNVIDGVISGSVTGNDLKDAATSIVGDGAKGLINNSNLPQNVKNAANAAIDGLMQNGLTGLTTNARDFISDYVADYLGDAAAGDAVGKIFDAVVTPGADPWQEIVNQAPVIGAAIGHKVVAEVEKFAAAQIDKLIAKCPALQKVLNKLGINGAGIINGVKNVFSVLKNAPDLQTALTKLGDMAVNFLKDIAGKLIDWALEWAISWINNNIIPKVVDWASETLAKMAGSTNNELLQKGLAWLSDQVKNCKKCAAIKIKVDGTGAKIVDKVDQWIKSKQSTTTTVLQTNGGKK